MATLSNNLNQENRKRLSWSRAVFPLFSTLATPPLTREDSLNRLQWHMIQAVSSIQ